MNTKLVDRNRKMKKQNYYNEEGELCEASVRKNIVLAELGEPLTIPLRILNENCNFKKKWDEIQTKWHGEPADGREACKKAYMKAYNQKPEVKARKKAYNQKPEVKAHKQKPEVKAHLKAYMRKYRQRPEVKAKIKAYYQKPEVKAKIKAYKKAYYQRIKLKKQNG
ncbi:MAG TPA: hypothetical protein ENH46_05665 [Candidatus Pacearchaeota archaeon]|nr:hypothetical protein [Candidatus Pacearchaeota archaeon]